MVLIVKVYLDSAENALIDFQDPATSYMTNLCAFNNLINATIFFIVIFVSYILIQILYTRKTPTTIKYFSHSFWLELIWTITPGVILIILAFPSFKLLYVIDEEFEPEISVGVKGYQWYWNYQLSEFDKLIVNFNSYTLSDDILDSGSFRLLSVDNELVLPILTPIKFLIGSNDVIHSFSVPSFGVKIDAIPGRINSVNTYILRSGTFFGQCSELCGSGHYNMSIGIKTVPYSEFIDWLINSEL